MSTKHTPGPWRVVPYDAGDRSWWSGTPSIQAPDELDCAIVHWAGFAQEYWRSARGDAEIHANARLIAAAPELLEALKTAVQLLEIWRGWTPSHCTAHTDFETLPEIQAARAAIAKATGEAK